MRSRAPALVAVVAFALAVAVVAVLAGHDGGVGGQRLVKLPIASVGGAAADEAAGAPSARSAMAFAGPTEYRVEGALPDLPSTAPAYRMGSVTTTAAVGRLANALRLDGEVKEDGDGWVVRSGDRELRVARVAGLPWFLGSSCPDAAVSSDGQMVPCAAVAVARAVDAGAGSAGGSVSSPGSAGSAGSAVGCPPEKCVVSDPSRAVDLPCEPGTACATQPAPPICTDNANRACPAPPPAPPPVPVCKGGTVECLPAPVPSCPPDVPCSVPAPSCPPNTACVEPFPVPEPGRPVPEPEPEKPVRPADLPSEADARTLARDVFARLGVGTDGIVVDDGWMTWEARVEARVDGLPVIGMDTGVSIGAKGAIERAFGFLATPDRIGEYPLVGAEAGLRRLTDGFGGFGGGFGGGPRRLVATDGGVVAKGQVDPARPECADPTMSCVPPPQPAPVVQVVSGAHLALLHSGEVLVPAYVFELKEGGTIPVPAVTDEWLDQQTPADTPATVED